MNLFSSKLALALTAFIGISVAVYAQAPAIIPNTNPITITLDASGNHTLVLSDVATVTSSITTNPQTQLTPASFNCATLGTQTVTVTATDGTFGTALNPSAVTFRTPRGLAFDAAGNLYLADAGSNKIRLISSAGIVSTFAGSGVVGSANGTGTAATFSAPSSVVVDPVSGNIFVADINNEVIRKITSAGVVTTFAGTAGVLGNVDGAGTAAQFNTPYGLAVDASGNIYVADQGNNEIRKITPAGVVTTLAGSGLPTFANGTGTAASFNGPTGLILDKTGNIFVADRGNNRIRMVTQAGVVTTFAGSGTAGAVNGTGVAAQFNGPSGITIDGSGNLYIADAGGNRIRKITSAAVVTIYAGTGTASAIDDIATLATFYSPWGVTIDAAGNLYIADQTNNKIRKITVAGLVSTLAGSGIAGATDGNIGGGANGNVSTLNIQVNVIGTFAITSVYNNVTLSSGSSGLAVLPDYASTAIATENCTVNNITLTQSPVAGTKIPAGSTVTVTITATDAASKKVNASFTATSVSPPLITPLSSNITLALDGSGNRPLLISDLATVTSSVNANPPIQISPSTLNCSTLGTQIITVTATDGTFGSALKPTAATFYAPRSLAFDLSGNMFIADAGSNKIRMLNTLGVVSTLAGSGAAGNNNSTGTAATFNAPSSVTTDGAGNVYVADLNNQVIRKITPAGVVTTLAGTGVAGRVNGTGTSASFNNPYGIVADVFGNVYVAEQGNNDVRKITPSGVVTTLAGRSTGVAGYVDGGGTIAAFNAPTGITLDSLGNLYVADRGNNRIRVITNAGIVSTFAGSGFAAYIEGTGMNASFKTPSDLTIDGLGNVYVADAGNNVVRKITPAGVVTTLAGGGAPASADGTGSAANFNNPWGIVLDANANLYVADQTNNKIRKITQGAVVTTIAGSGTAGSLDGIVGGGATGNITTVQIPVTVVSSPVITTVFGNVTLSTGTNSTVALPDYISQATATDNCAGKVTFAQSPAAGTLISIGSSLTVTLTAADVFGGKATAVFTVSAVSPPVITPLSSNITITLDGSGGKTLALTDLATLTSSVNLSPPVQISPATLSCSNLGTQTITVTATDGNFGTNVNPAAVTFRAPRGAIFDAAGNLYIAETGGNRIRKITPAGIVSTFAGSGSNGNANGTGTAASFNAPSALAIDPSGNLYVADVSNELIRKITPAGVVSTFAGSGAIGRADGTGTAAQFNTPYGVATDKSGNVYVADYGNSLIRKITQAGVVTTLAGTGTAGFVNGTGTAAAFNFPTGLACDSLGNIYVADRGNSRIRKITPGGIVTTIAGGSYAYADGIGTAASFKNPSDLTLDPSGNIYVADVVNNMIRMVTPAGVVTSLAGAGSASFADGTGIAASFNSPWGITIDKLNNLYITDINNNRIRKVTTLGVVTTFAGSGVSSSIDGNIGGGANGNVTTLQIPVKVISTPVITSTYINVTLLTGIGGTATLTNYALTATAIDNCSSSAIVFTQSPAAGTVVTPGSPITVSLTATDATGTKATTSFTVSAVSPPIITARPNLAFVLDATGNKTVTLSDIATVTSAVTANPQVQISPATLNCATVGQQTLTVTATDGVLGSPLTPTAVSFNAPEGVTIDIAGNIYITDTNNSRIRKISNTGVVSTFVASGVINTPYGITIDGSGNLYVSDPTHTIKKVTPAGMVTIYAGLPGAGSVDGPIASASFNSPGGLAMDVSGNLYVADFNNKNIRKISTSGTVSTVATFTDGPTNLTTDLLGNLYFTTSSSGLLRKITPAGVMSLVAGGGASDVNGTGAAAGFLSPTGLATDASGNIYVSQFNGKIRKVSQAGITTTFAGGNGTSTDATGILAGFNEPYGIAIDNSGNAIVADFLNNKVRKTTPAAVVTTLAGNTNPGAVDGNVGSVTTGNVSILQIPVTVTSMPFITSVLNNVTIPVGLSGKVLLPDYTAGATATDNCTASNVTFTQTPAAGTLLAINNAQTVTLTATDASGAKAVKTFSVTALSPPVITPISSNIIITLDGTGNKTIQLSDVATVTSLSNANPPVQLSVSGFNCFTVGAQTVTVTATDGVFPSGSIAATGNVTVLQIPVTVISTPVITSVYNNVIIPVSTAASAALPNYAASATIINNCSASPVTVTQTPLAGTILPINIAQVVTLTATDASGNKATKNFTVTAFSPPVITPKTGLSFVLNASGSRTLQLSDLASVSSLTNINPPVQINPSILTCSTLGTQIITVTTTDGTFGTGGIGATGSVTTVQISVTVTSTPTITSIYSNVSLPVDATGKATIPDYTANATGSDNCTISTIRFTQLPLAGTTLAVNTTTIVTLTATDELGGVATTSFTVTAIKANQNISFLALPQITYGFNDFDPAAIAGSALAVSYTSSNTAVASLINGKIHIVGAGSTIITASQGGNSNFNTATPINQTLTVSQTILTVSADNQSKIAGTANPVLTISYLGFVNGDTFASLNTQPSISTTASTNSAVGLYPISIGGASSTNYAVSYQRGILNVVSPNQVSPVITARSNNTIFTLDATGNRPIILSDIAAVTSNNATPPTVQLSTTNFDCTAVGLQVVTITATNPGLSGLVTTLQIPVTVLSTPVITSGYKDVSLQVDNTGTIKLPDYTLAATASDNCGSNAVNFTQVPAVGTVMSLNTSTTVTLTATDASGATTSTAFTAVAVKANQTINYTQLATVAYGSADVDPGATATSGLPPSYASSNALVATIVNGKVHITGAGTATLSISQSGNANFNVAATVSETLTVAQVPLLITANNQTKVYGSANPALTVGYSGFVNGDDATKLVSQPTTATTAVTSSAVGTYIISPANAIAQNYIISYATGNLSISPAVLNITAVNQTKVYGTANPFLTVSYNGFVNNDDATKLANQPTITTTATLTSHTTSYSITPSGAASPNYTIAYTVGNLVITPAALSIIAISQTKIYGAANPVFTVTYNGLVNGDVAGNLTTQPTVTTPATAVSPTGSYTLTPGSAISVNYTITYLTGTLTINKASLTITADTQTKVYGSANPALTVTYTGFVNGDDATKLVTQSAITTTATVASSVGTYPITAIAAGSPNYTISYLAGNLVVTQANLTITANNQSKVYGAGNPSLTMSYTGFVSGDDATKLVTQAASTTPATLSSATGTYIITSSGASSLNYTISYIAGILTVSPAALLVTANSQSKIYGSANPALTVSYSGFLNGDDITKLATPAIVATAAITNSATGTYTITASGASSSNYNIAYATGTLTISPATLIITAINQTKVYGTANPTLAVTYNGFVNVDNANMLISQPGAFTTATATSTVGTYSIIVTGASSPNYNISYVAATLTVTPAVLTVTANNQVKTYGGANPSLTVNYSGFLNGDTFTSLNTQPIGATTATPASPVGIYRITVSGVTASNYNIVYLGATLTVNPAALIVSADNQNKVYGVSNPTLTVNYIGFVNGDTFASLTTQPVTTTTATSASGAGGYPITAGGASSSNYSMNYNAGTLTVNPAVLTITANNQSKVYGTGNPVLTVIYSGFVNGDTFAVLTTLPTVTTTAISSSNVGVYTITPIGAGTANYSINYNPGTLTVNAAALTITANNQTKTYGAANPISTASYSGFVNGDSFASLVTQPTLATAATLSSAVGSYTISANGATSNNYTITYVAGNLTITPALITFNQLPIKTYGDIDFAPGATSSVNISYTSSNTAVATIVAGNIHVIGAGNTIITATNGSGTATQLLTVSPAPLLIAANNQTRFYGIANPTFTLTYTGFVNGETAANLIIQPIVTTTGTITSAIGNYPITARGAASNNYAITYTPAVLSVNIAPRTLTFNALPTKTYGDADFDPAGTITSGETITYTSSNTAIATIINGKVHIVTTGTVTITASVPVNGNYVLTASQTQTLLINKTNQTISFSAIPAQQRGAIMTLNVLSTSGLPVALTSSDVSIATITGQTLNSLSLGTVVITATQPGDNNYLPVAVIQTLKIQDDVLDAVLVHTGVSPNGDGINDFLFIEGIKDYPDNKLSIVNRNGAKIFEILGYDNVKNVFDGHTNDGSVMPAGTYFYSLMINLNGQPTKKVGYIILKYF